MRKAILTILMAATAAAPALAQDNDGGWRGRGHRDGGSQTNEQRSEARAERMQQREQAQQPREQVQQQREQVQQQRVERQQAAPQQQTEARSWQGRSGGSWQRGESQQQAVQVQQQQQVRTEAYRGSRGGNWSGGDRGDRNAQRFQAEREAAQRSAEQTIGGNYARRAAENERNYERQTLRREGQRDERRWDGNRGNYDRGAYRNNDRNRGYNWNRDWRNDRRYDWQRYRYSNRSIFNPGRYYAPYRGYGYNRLSIGLVLDELFFGRNYWISDPWQYRLPAAPYGTQWVRYFDDVVLVDVYTGEVVDVIYDFFY
jgi:hypothetical protein